MFILIDTLQRLMSASRQAGKHPEWPKLDALQSGSSTQEQPSNSSAIADRSSADI
jgi:hypothetical protein